MVRACPVCKSRKWHREPLSGLIACSEGHVLANYRNETNETNDPMGPYQLKKRTMKKQRKAGVELSMADPKFYHGDRAKFHYLQCLQLLFRKQVAALISAWSLPPEFEVICRDTWALHLALLPEEVPAEPLNSVAAGPSAPVPGPPVPSQGAQNTGALMMEQLENSASSKSASGDEEDQNEAEEPEAEAEEANSDLAELLSEVSASSSSDEDALPGTPGHQKQQQHQKPSAAGMIPRHRRLTLHRPNARDTDYATPRGNIAVLVVALWILRVPVIYNDLIMLIERHTLPYLAPLHHLPAAMALHLNKQTTQALSPPFSPRPAVVHNLAARLAKKMYAQHRIFVPELNAAPILWRAVRALNGSPLLYSLSKRLMAELDVPLTLHPSLASVLSGGGQAEAGQGADRVGHGKHHFENGPPELAIVSAVVLVLKLMYGLDGVKRKPKDENDPLASMPQAEEWLASLRAAKEQNDIYAAPSDLTVLDMSEAEMDRYLAFCQRALVDPRPGVKQPDSDFKQQFFPLPPVQDEPEVHDSPFSSYSEFTATPLSQDPDAVLPGSQHVRYSHMDPSGTIPPEYELVLEVAAKWAGVDTEGVLTVVEMFERRLERRWKEERKTKRRLSVQEVQVGHNAPHRRSRISASEP